MISIFKYETETEAQAIIAEQTAQGLILVEIMNITEGNFLGFADADSIPPPITPIEKEVEELKAKDAEIIFTLVMNDLM